MGRFTEISDQLRFPLINVCDEYHYSPEIISGHILLEVIKSRLQEDNNIADQEVKSGEYLGMAYKRYQMIIYFKRRIGIDLNYFNLKHLFKHC